MDTRRDRNGPIENGDRLGFSGHRIGSDGSTVTEKRVIGGRCRRLPGRSGRRGFGVEGGLGNGHHLIMNRRRGGHRGVVGRLRRGKRLFVGRVGSGPRRRKVFLRRGDRCGVGLLGSLLRGGLRCRGRGLGGGQGRIGRGHRLVVASPGELHDRVERSGRDPHARLESALGSGNVDLELPSGRRHCPNNELIVADVERRRASARRAAGGQTDGGGVTVFVLLLGIRQACCGSGRFGSLIEAGGDDRPVVPQMGTGDDLVLKASAVGRERVSSRIEPFLCCVGCGGRGGDARLKGPHRR